MDGKELAKKRIEWNCVSDTGNSNCKYGMSTCVWRSRKKASVIQVW